MKWQILQGMVKEEVLYQTMHQFKISKEYFIHKNR